VTATVRNLLIRISVTEKTDTGIRKVTTNLKETNREINQADKGSSRFSGTLSKLGRTSLTSLVSGLKGISKFTLAAGKGLLVVAASASALNTATQAGVSLAPLLGGLALLPAVAVSAATAIGVLKIATSGLGDAFKDALKPGTSAKDLAGELKYVSPAARATVLELNKLQPTLLGIRNTIQQALFQPLVGQLTALAKVLGGPIKTGAAAVATEFGAAGRQVAEFARQAKSIELVKAAFGQTQLSVSILRTALTPLLAGFRALGTEGLSFLPRIATAVASIASRFGEWLQKIVASGQATKWIDNFFDTLSQLGGVLKNVGGIMSSVFSAASAAGSGFLGVIGQSLAQLNAFLKTAAGKGALQSIFQGLAAIGQSLGPVIAALVAGLGVLAKPLGMLAQLVGPILTTAIQALAPALAALAPGLKAIFVGLGGAVKAIAPVLAPLGNALAQIGVAIGPILPVVGQLIGQLGVKLAPILGQLFIALGPLALALVRLLGAFAPLIPPLALIIVQLVQGLVPALTPIIGIIGQIAGVIGQFFVTGLQMLLAAVLPLLPQLSQMAQTLGTQLLTVLVALSPALLQVLQALLPLLPSLISMTPVFVQLVVAATPLIVLLIKLAAVILRTLLPPIVAITGWFLKFNAAAWIAGISSVAKVVGAVRKLPGAISGVFKGAGNWLWNAGRAIINGLVNGIKSAVGWLKDNLSWVTSLIPSWKGPLDVDKRLLTPNGAAIMGSLVAGITSRLPALKQTLAGVSAEIGGGVTAPAGVGAAATAPRGVTAVGQSGGMAVKVTLDVTGGDAKFRQMVRKWVRVDSGGNVQVALGGTG
jgi:hypothetical protein